MITFKADGKTLLIGGQESLGAGGKGLTGPFPRYSISREDVTTGNGNNEKWRRSGHYSSRTETE